MRLSHRLQIGRLMAVARWKGIVAFPVKGQPNDTQRPLAALEISWGCSEESVRDCTNVSKSVLEPREKLALEEAVRRVETEAAQRAREAAATLPSNAA